MMEEQIIDTHDRNNFGLIMHEFKLLLLSFIQGWKDPGVLCKYIQFPHEKKQTCRKALKMWQVWFWNGDKESLTLNKQHSVMWYSKTHQRYHLPCSIINHWLIFLLHSRQHVQVMEYFLHIIQIFISWSSFYYGCQ